MKVIGILVAVLGLAGCSSRPTNFTAAHCTSNIHCKSDESCLTWREEFPSSASKPEAGHWYRDGLCVRDE
jgi:hypothetical protein